MQEMSASQMTASQQLLGKTSAFIIDKAHLPAYNSGKIYVLLSVQQNLNNKFWRRPSFALPVWLQGHCNRCFSHQKQLAGDIIFQLMILHYE